MPLTVGSKNLMLDALAAVVDRISAHTDAPGSTGANEVTGGTYARQAITWDAASGGAINLAAGVSFNVPAATTVTHLGFWTNSGAVFRGFYDIPDEAFASGGVLEVPAGAIDLNAIASA